MQLHAINYKNDTVIVDLMSLLHLRPTEQLTLPQKKFLTGSVSHNQPDQEVRIPQKQNISAFSHAMLHFNPTYEHKKNIQGLSVSHPPLRTGITTTQGSEKTQVSSEATFSFLYKNSTGSLTSGNCICTGI